MVDIYERTFIFSKEQMKRKQEIEGKNAKFGTVTVKGSSKIYTEIVRRITPNLPSDYEILITDLTMLALLWILTSIAC